MTTMVTRLDRAPGIEDSGRVSGAGRKRPDPEVPARARRRTFTAQYKLEILAAYDAAAEGEKGALLRREGLYSSHIVEWRKARDAGALAGLAAPRGRKRRDPQADKIARLEAEKLRLEQELAKARFVVNVQAKVHALLETPCESADTEPRPAPTSHSSRDREARTGGDRAEPGVVVGHHQAARPREVDLVLPLRDLGHLLALRRRVDGRQPGIRRAGRGVDPPDLCQAGHRP